MPKIWLFEFSGPLAELPEVKQADANLQALQTQLEKGQMMVPGIRRKIQRFCNAENNPVKSVRKHWTKKQKN